MGEIAGILRVGGHPALDFVNTLGGLPSTADDEYLHNYDDLLTWVHGSELLDAPTTEEMRSVAARHPARARAAHRAALDLRHHLDALLRGRLRDQPSDDRDLRALRDAYSTAVARAELVPRHGGYAWTWIDLEVDRPLWPIAYHAVELLRSGPLPRLAQCEHCRWLYLDTSKNRTRRWCSMTACGAVMKMRRYRASRRL